MLLRRKIVLFYKSNLTIILQASILKNIENNNILRGGAVVARQAHNLKAVGSIPAPATNRIFNRLKRRFFCAQIAPFSLFSDTFINLVAG